MSMTGSMLEEVPKGMKCDALHTAFLMGECVKSMAEAFVGVHDGTKSCHYDCGEHGSNGGLCGLSATMMSAVEYLSPKCDGVDACSESFASTRDSVSGVLAKAFMLGGNMSKSCTLVGM